jgi:type VI secretion system secreted protein VgrG
MATAPTGDFRSVSINTTLGKDVLVLSRVVGREELSRLFEYRVELLSTRPNITADSIIGTNATLILSDPVGPQKAEKTARYVNAVFTSFSEAGSVHNPAFPNGVAYAYRGVLNPFLWFLTRRSDCRTFADMSVEDIVKQIVATYGIQIETRLGGGQPIWKYCVQYRETDFNFISRLMEQEGIYYYHEHSNGAHKLVLMNGSATHAMGPRVATMAPMTSTHTSAEGKHVLAEALTATTTAQPGKFAHADYDFFRMLQVEGVASDPATHMYGDLEIYDYPSESIDVAGAGAGRDSTSAYATARLQELRAQYRVLTGAAPTARLETGYRLTVSGAGTLDATYLVTATMLNVTVTGFATGGAASGADARVEFSGIPATKTFRAQRLTPKPVIQGAQTAIVTSEPDQYARVKLQFPWMRDGTVQPRVRVGQIMAGKKWGAVFIPRVNQEVIVEFLDGDPDRPIITAVVYNGVNMPPYQLPDKKTMSTMKTNSFDGGGFNEIRFEDKSGDEQLFIHAQKQLDIRVLKDSLTHIGKDSHLFVVENRKDEIKKDDHLKVLGDRNVQVVGISSLKADQKIQMKSGTASAVDAGTEIHLKAGTNIILEAGVGITLKAGANSIVLGPSGITIDGVPMVKVNSGGSPGSGAGSSPTAPQQPTEADNAAAGQKEAAPEARQPPPATTYSPQAVALQQAAESGAPFCEN